MEKYENASLQGLSRGELIRLVSIYAKNMLALDGVWFQSVERKLGMDEAMFHDVEAWRRFTVTEARRIKAFLRLPENAGLEGLAAALPLRYVACASPYEIDLEGGRLIYRTVECSVQAARKKKGMPLHPCKAVGLVEYAGFAAVIDSRIACRCVRCYPDAPKDEAGCAWEFHIG